MTERGIVPEMTDRQKYMCGILTEAVYFHSIVDDRMQEEDTRMRLPSGKDNTRMFNADEEFLAIAKGAASGARRELVYELVPDEENPGKFIKKRSEEMKRVADGIFNIIDKK